MNYMYSDVFHCMFYQKCPLLLFTVLSVYIRRLSQVGSVVPGTSTGLLSTLVSDR